MTSLTNCCGCALLSAIMALMPAVSAMNGIMAPLALCDLLLNRARRLPTAGEYDAIDIRDERRLPARLSAPGTGQQVALSRLGMPASVQ